MKSTPLVMILVARLSFNNPYHLKAFSSLSSTVWSWKTTKWSSEFLITSIMSFQLLQINHSFLSSTLYYTLPNASNRTQHTLSYFSTSPSSKFIRYIFFIPGYRRWEMYQMFYCYIMWSAMLLASNISFLCMATNLLASSTHFWFFVQHPTPIIIICICQDMLD